MDTKPNPEACHSFKMASQARTEFMGAMKEGDHFRGSLNLAASRAAEQTGIMIQQKEHVKNKTLPPASSPVELRAKISNYLRVNCP